MAAREVSWQSAFWALPPLAINTMMQPSGRVCGCDPSLRTYLRSSPIVCVFDAVFIIIRVATYRCVGLSARAAAKKVIDARGGGDDDAELGGIRSLERNVFLRCLVLVVGVLTQAVKLLACSGLPWTRAWGCFYLSSFIVVEVMNGLAKFAGEEDSTVDSSVEDWLTLFEKVWGAAAVVLQLALLASVDLAAEPPDPILIRRWVFRLFRMSAHGVVFLIHVPLMLLQSEAPTRPPNRRLAGLMMSILVLFIFFASTQLFRFSQLYFMVSIIISSFAWLLYFFQVTKKHVLLCGPGDRGLRNVLAFDFFCRNLCFALFWYIVLYDPTGTFKPKWTDNLG